MAYIPEVKDLRRAPATKVNPPLRNASVTVQQLQAEYESNPKRFKPKKELKPWQKQAIRCNYDLRNCRRDEIDRTFYGY